MDPLEARWWSYIRAVQGDNADSDKPASSQKPLPMVSLERTKLGSPGAPMSLAWHPRFPSVVFAGSGTGEIFSVALSNGRIAVPRPPADEKDDDPKMAALRRFPSVAAELYNRDYISAAREAAMAVSTGDVDAGTARALLACLPTEAAKDSSWTPQSQGGDARPEFRKQIELFSLGMQPPLKAPPPLPAPLPTILAALQLRLELEDRVAAGKWEAVAKRAREVVAGVESEFSGSGWSIPVWTGEVLLVGWRWLVQSYCLSSLTSPLLHLHYLETRLTCHCQRPTSRRLPRRSNRPNRPLVIDPQRRVPLPHACPTFIPRLIPDRL